MQLPDYDYIDCFLNWNTRKDGIDYSVGLNIQNLTDNIFMNEADETWFTDPQTNEQLQGTYDNGRLEGYWGFGRTVSVSVKMGF